LRHVVSVSLLSMGAHAAAGIPEHSPTSCAPPPSPRQPPAPSPSPSTPPVFTHRFEAHVSPGSHAPPAVHGPPSEPTGLSHALRATTSQTTTTANAAPATLEARARARV